ncbi:hypothetical protein [Cobetia crustatorum]|uniref:Uncharacterized protein n=1 Tax=Cobetia crustatorum TaxID=553385 RepID=A0A558HXM6_9GAMM|nr:hypothetical protein [Cobetia crustatorum]TVU73892.1 hypothetical protein FQP86_02160 [Cobetia crustatorum]
MSPVDTTARPCTLPASGSVASRRWSVRTAPRWLLASLLLSCLFPAGLSVAQVERVNLTLASIQLLAPAVIRAESRRQGLRSLRRLARPARKSCPRSPCHRRYFSGVFTLLRGLVSAASPRAPPVLS